MQKQREILAERKRIEREYELAKFVNEEKSDEPTSQNFNRPMSSRAARKVLSGVDPSKIKESVDQTSYLTSEEERRRLEARKALAETLKREVIQNSGSKK